MITSVQANGERVDFTELYEILGQIQFDTMTPLLQQHLYSVTMEKKFRNNQIASKEKVETEVTNTSCAHC